MRSSRMMAAAVALIGGLALGVMTIGPPVADAGAQGASRPPGRAVETNVDVELVIAVDVSYSMDPDEQALQREGYLVSGLFALEDAIDVCRCDICCFCWNWPTKSMGGP